jgi:hypothetical protein
MFDGLLVEASSVNSVEVLSQELRNIENKIQTTIL